MFAWKEICHACMLTMSPSILWMWSLLSGYQSNFLISKTCNLVVGHTSLQKTNKDCTGLEYITTLDISIKNNNGFYGSSNDDLISGSSGEVWRPFNLHESPTYASWFQRCLSKFHSMMILPPCLLSYCMHPVSLTLL